MSTQCPERTVPKNYFLNNLITLLLCYRHKNTDIFLTEGVRENILNGIRMNNTVHSELLFWVNYPVRYNEFKFIKLQFIWINSRITYLDMEYNTGCVWIYILTGVLKNQIKKMSGTMGNQPQCVHWKWNIHYRIIFCNSISMRF